MTGQPVDNIPDESWKPIPHMPYGTTQYYASNLGRIKRTYLNKKNEQKEYLLKPWKNEKGFIRAALTLSPRNEDRASTYTSRLVLMSFQPVDHMLNLDIIYKDGNPENCQLENLKWGTRKEVWDQRLTWPSKGRTSISKYISPVSGEIKLKLIKVPDHTIRDIINLQDSGMTQEQIAKRFGITQACVSMILSGKRRNSTTEINRNRLIRNAPRRY